MGPNGSGELHLALERIIEAFGWLRKALDAMSDKLSETSERREREYEAVRHILTDIQKAVALLDSQIGEARGDVSDLEKRWTPAQGVPVYNPPVKNGSGPTLALTESKFKLHMPSSWAFALLKLALSIGVGAGALRFAQWMIGRR